MKTVIGKWRDVSGYVNYLNGFNGNNLLGFNQLADTNLTNLGGNNLKGKNLWSEPVYTYDEKLSGWRGRKFTPGVLGWLFKFFFWKKRILLQPITYYRGTVKFVIGFYEQRTGVCMVLDREFMINFNNPIDVFAMRVGPDGVGFFTVSDYHRLALKSCGFTHGDIKLF